MPFQERVSTLLDDVWSFKKVSAKLYTNILSSLSVAWPQNHVCRKSDFYVSCANLKEVLNMKVLDNGKISVDQYNSPQIYLFLKVDIWRTISHSKIYSSF